MLKSVTNLDDVLRVINGGYGVNLRLDFACLRVI